MAPLLPITYPPCSLPCRGAGGPPSLPLPVSAPPCYLLHTTSDPMSSPAACFLFPAQFPPNTDFAPCPLPLTASLLRYRAHGSSSPCLDMQQWWQQLQLWDTAAWLGTGGSVGSASQEGSRVVPDSKWWREDGAKAKGGRQLL